jgi:hypothetical protein
MPNSAVAVASDGSLDWCDEVLRFPAERGLCGGVVGSSKVCDPACDLKLDRAQPMGCTSSTSMAFMHYCFGYRARIVGLVRCQGKQHVSWAGEAWRVDTQHACVLIGVSCPAFVL